MNTQTHLLLASALLGRGATGRGHRAILVGAFLPDLSIFALAAWGAATGMEPARVWGTAYWSEPWQSASALLNSMPVWAAVLLVAIAARRRGAVLLCAAALSHLALDLPLHADDAHRHFWPLSDFRFHSPVSYWDPRHYGRVVSLLEAVGGLAFCVLLWRRHTGRAARAALALCAAGYVLVPAFWLWTVR